MRIRVEDYRREAGSIVIAKPNAPTGIALPRAEIARLLGEHPSIRVVIDEAYADFGGESAVPLIADHPNLLVVQTMSKPRALAGLRLGYALGDAGLIEAQRRVKDSFNFYPLGRVAQTGATASVRERRLFPRELRQGRRQREHAVLVRHFNKPRAVAYLRITVGMEDDTKRLIAAAAEILGRG